MLPAHGNAGVNEMLVVNTVLLFWAFLGVLIGKNSLHVANGNYLKRKSADKSWSNTLMSACVCAMRKTSNQCDVTLLMLCLTHSTNFVFDALCQCCSDTYRINQVAAHSVQCACYLQSLN